MTRNDELWAQENGVVEDTTAPNAGLRSVGVSNAGIQQDLDTLTPNPIGEIPLGAVPGGPEEAGAAGSAPQGGAGVPSGGLGL